MKARKAASRPNIEPLTILVTMMGRLKVNVQGNQVNIYRNKLNSCGINMFDESTVVVLDDIYNKPVSRETASTRAIIAGLKCVIQGFYNQINNFFKLFQTEIF